MTSKTAASLFTLLGGGLWLLDDSKPVVTVNEGASFRAAPHLT